MKKGILVIGRVNCYLIDGLGLTGDNKIKPIASMSPEEQVLVIPSNKNESENSTVTVHKFQLSMLRNIEKRRYLLQPIALELFLSNGRTHLVAFERSERQRALHRIIQYADQARVFARKNLCLSESIQVKFDQFGEKFVSVFAALTFEQKPNLA